MRGVGEEVVAHQAMNDTVEGILEVGRGIEVTAVSDTMLSGEYCMGSIRPHDPGYECVMYKPLKRESHLQSHAWGQVHSFRDPQITPLVWWVA